MKFGIFALPTYFAERDGSINAFYQRVLRFLIDAEELGFDSVWVNEHHFHPFGGMIPHPAVMLAAVAARTSRVRIGTSVSLLPLHHPLELAEAYAMVDQLSGGRLEFGVGRGFSAHDFEKMGVSYHDAQERLIETLKIILKAWQRRPFSHRGRYYEFTDVELWPPPVQAPHPPVWMAASRNPDSFAWIGSKGYNLLTVVYLKPLDELAGLIRRYREAAEAGGHDPRNLQVATHYQVYVSEDGDEARREAAEALDRYLALSKDARNIPPATGGSAGEVPSGAELVASGRVLAGTPAECVEVLERAAETLGITGVDCTFTFGGIEHEKARRSFELFAREVIPRLRRAAAPADRIRR